MTILHTIILSFVEGVTEFLPISSTAHLILASKLLGIGSGEFAKSFEIAIQLGAILSIIYLYIREILAETKIIKNIIYAFIPTAIVGFALFKIIKGIFFDSTYLILAALSLGGIIIILYERYRTQGTKSIAELSPKQSILIGLIQALSVIPGVSRAAASIIGSEAMSLSREQAVKFSFLLAVPTIAGATALDIVKTNWQFSRGQFLTLGLGMILSYFFALISVRWLLRFVSTHNLKWFGYYRIVLAIVMLLLLS